MLYQGMTFPWDKGVGNGCGLGKTFVLPREWPIVGFQPWTKYFKNKTTR